MTHAKSLNGLQDVLLKCTVRQILENILGCFIDTSYIMLNLDLTR